MTEPWPAAVAAIDRLSRIGTILHIGGGEGAELRDYLATRADRIVLVEPNPELVPELERAAATDERVRVLPVAVSGKAGRATLNSFNFAALSSLRTPTGLQELFPGLRRTGELVVETLALADVLQEAEITEAASNILVIDAPGEERQIVKDLIDNPWAMFSHIVLRSAAAPVYEGAAPVRELIAILEDHGYRVTGQLDSDADFPEIHLRLEPLVLENRRLAEALERANSKAREAGDACDASVARAKSAEEEIAVLQKSYDDLQAQLEKCTEELQRTRSELEAQITQRQAVMSGDQKKLSSQARIASDLREKVTMLEQALSEEEARRRQMENEITRAEAQMEILREFMIPAATGRVQQ